MGAKGAECRALSDRQLSAGNSRLAVGQRPSVRDPRHTLDGPTALRTTDIP
jgi:hypothetical protein